jgi:hypothetical protein
MARPVDLFAPAPAKRRVVPYEFVLEQLAPLGPTTKPMFGSLGVYLDERVVFILRRKGDADDGVWLAFEPELEAEVLALFPALCPIEVLGKVRAWRKLAASSATFEDDALRVCKLLLSGDTRLGKLPERLKAKRKLASKTAKPRAVSGPGAKPGGERSVKPRPPHKSPARAKAKPAR